MGHEKNNNYYSNNKDENSQKKDADEWKVMSDEPSLSSAALATTFHLVGHTFHPEFTHQCLKGERYRGYRPLLLDDNDDYNNNSNNTVLLSSAPQQAISHGRNQRRRPFTTLVTKDPSTTNNDNDNDNNHHKKKKVIWHESHRHHYEEASTQPLHVQIHVAPSGERCRVEFHHTLSSLLSASPLPPSSSVWPMTNRENNNNDEDEESEESPVASKKRKTNDTHDSSPTTTTTTTTPPTTTTVTTVPPPMSEVEILAAIGKALPPLTTHDCHDDYLTQPLGTVLKEYTRRRRSSSSGCSSTGTGASAVNEDNPSSSSSLATEETTTFVVTVADGRSVVDYHSKIQPLALWFIENADEVDVSDDQSGFWKVLYLFQQHNDNNNKDKKYSLAGYLTLFHFHAPFHKPTPGIIARICQALVFPPYQGEGHGMQMMQCVYELAHGMYPPKGIYHEAFTTTTIVQVNVEDPSPGFVELRNAMDFHFLTQQEDHRTWWPENTIIHVTAASHDTLLRTMRPEAIGALSEDEARHVADKAKLLPRQVQLVNEWLTFQAIRRMEARSVHDDMDDKKDDDDRRRRIEELETRFRLMVKSRLNREHRDDMSDYPSKDAKKAYLNQLYKDEINHYPAWLTQKAQQERK